MLKHLTHTKEKLYLSIDFFSLRKSTTGELIRKVWEQFSTVRYIVVFQININIDIVQKYAKINIDIVPQTTTRSTTLQCTDDPPPPISLDPCHFFFGSVLEL